MRGFTLDSGTEVPKFVVRDANVLDLESGVEENHVDLIFEDGVLYSIDKETSNSRDAIPSIDVDGAWVLPALVDQHLHPAPIASPFPNRMSERTPTRRYGPRGTSQAHSNLKEAFLAGVMCARDMGTPQEALDQLTLYRTGELPPLINSCVRPITGIGGHLSNIGFEVESTTDIENSIEKLKMMGASHVKTVKDPSISEKLFNDLVDLAHGEELPVCCHVYTDEATETAIRAECDSIEHAFPPNQELATLAEKNGTTFVPTFYCSETALLPTGLTDILPDDLHIFEKWNEQLHRNVEVAINSNVNIGIGTDAGMPPVGFGDLWKEIQCLANLGFSNERLIKSATTSGAESLGRSGEWMIEEGESAYLVLLDSDPRENVEAFRSARPLVFNGIPMYSMFDNIIEGVDS